MLNETFSVIFKHREPRDLLRNRAKMKKINDLSIALYISIVTTVFSGRITYVKWGETTNIKKWNIGTNFSSFFSSLGEWWSSSEFCSQMKIALSSFLV